MSEQKLKTAVLGLNEGGELILKAASKIDNFRIEAVADENVKLAESLAEEYNCTCYNDYRQLIIQNQFDCLLVAAGTYSCDEYIRMAMKKKFNILKLAPLARNFAEAAELVGLADEENVKFAVANTSRFAQSFLALREFVHQYRGEQIFLISAVCNVVAQGCPAWQTDPKLAGGGVLLCNCYGIIDQILSNFGIPQQVYSLSTSQAGDKQQRLYLTEDTAIVTMKFSDTFFGNLTASRTLGPEQKLLKLYGKDKALTVSDNQFTVSDHLGRITEQSEYSDDELCRMTGVLENFASSVLAPDEYRLVSGAGENLRNMAVIESAYLSSRTAMPEQPEKILKMTTLHSPEPTNIRPAGK